MKSRLATVFVFLIALVFMLLTMPLWADDCRGNKPCNSTDVTVSTGDMVGGDTVLNNDSRALALSNAMGDVDIAGCLGSTQWATPLFSKQKLVVNWPCLTEFYLRNGKYELASMAICNTEIVKEFASEADCEAAHDFEAMAEEVIVMAESEEEVEYLREELQEQAMLQADLNAKIENLEQSKRVVIHEPYLSDDKKDRLREIVNE